MYHLQEGKDEEGLALLEKEFARMDRIKHPLHELLAKKSKPRYAKAKTVVPQESKHDFIPSWWRGDSHNYVVAKSVMKDLPR